MKEPKKIDQTEFGELGNCMSACLAMILGRDLSEVPNFTSMNLADWERYKVMQEWLNEEGFQLLTFNAWRGDLWPPKGFHIAGGETSRGFLHAVIIKDGKLWHDPHPSREGIKEIQTVDLLIPLVTWER